MRDEPSSVAAIPHPSSFANTTRFAESDEWFACGRAPNASQGWKLYVPLTMVNACEIIEQLAPLVSNAGRHFKYVKDIKTLRKLNAGMFGYTQIGKCFVVYFDHPDGEFIEQVKTVLRPFRDQCPTVPCARPFGDDLPLYYRYGSFDDEHLELGGELLTDDRSDADAAVPAGIVDAIAPYAKEVVDHPDIRPFLLRYPAYRALQQQGKCGIFVALDIASETFREVVLKVGYHRGQVQPDGTDGCHFVRREIAFYPELAERNLEEMAPQFVDALDVPRKAILVIEYIAGRSLLSRKLQGELTVDHLDRCWDIINCFHDKGLYLGDAKLANFLATDEGDLRVLDFEAAGIMGDRPPDMRTFFLENFDSNDPCVTDQAHFLVSVLFPYEVGRHSWEDRHVDVARLIDREPDSDISAWAIEKLHAVKT